MKVKLNLIQTKEFNIRSQGTTCYGYNDDDCCEAYKEQYCLLFGKIIPADYRYIRDSLMPKKLPECFELCANKQKEITIELNCVVEVMDG